MGDSQEWASSRHCENAQFASAVKVWQQATQAYQVQGDRLNQAMVLSNLALGHQALGQLPEAKNAIAAYSEAQDTLKSLCNDLVAINSEVQFSFREGVEPVYREFVSLLLQRDSNKTSPDRLEKAHKVIESLQLAGLDNFSNKLSNFPSNIKSILILGRLITTCRKRTHVFQQGSEALVCLRP